MTTLSTSRELSGASSCGYANDMEMTLLAASYYRADLQFCYEYDLIFWILYRSQKIWRIEQLDLDIFE